MIGTSSSQGSSSSFPYSASTIVPRSDVPGGSTFSGDTSTAFKSVNPASDQSESVQTSTLPDESNTSPMLIDIYGSTAFSGATQDPPDKISVTSHPIVTRSSRSGTESGGKDSNGPPQRSHTSAIAERDPIIADLTTPFQWTSSAASLTRPNNPSNSHRHANPSENDNKVPYSKVTAKYHKDRTSTAAIVTYQANALGHSEEGSPRQHGVTTSLSFRSTVFSLLSSTRLSHSTASNFAFTHADASASWQTESLTSDRTFVEASSSTISPKSPTSGTPTPRVEPTPWGLPRTSTNSLWEGTATFNTSHPGNRSSTDGDDQYFLDVVL